MKYFKTHTQFLNERRRSKEPFTFSEKEVKDIADLIAKAIAKVDKTKAAVHDMEFVDGEGAGFEISIDGEKYDGGSYDVRPNGEVVNVAIGNSFPNAIYAKIGDKNINQIIKNIKKFESAVTEAKINLKAAHLSSEEYQKAKKLKDFDKEDWEWNSKSGLYDRVNEATDVNDPVLVAFRASRRELPKLKPAKAKSRRLSFDKYMDLLDARLEIDQQIKDLGDQMAQTLRDMEQEAEPEGGEVADRYGSIMMDQEKEYAKLKAKKDKIMARIDKHRMS